MKRRAFIKRGALFAPTIFIPRLIRAQSVLTADGLAAFGTNAPTGGGGGGGGGSCDSLNDSNLVSYFRLDEASSTRSDTKGSNSLTPSASTGSATGVNGNAAHFTGSTYLSHASNSSLQTGAINWSAGFWFNVSSTTNGGNFQALMGKFSEWVVNLTSSGVLRFLTTSGSGAGANLDYSGTISANTWYFVVVTYTSTGNKAIYVNAGTPNTTPTSTLITAGTDAFTIGSVLNTWFLVGNVDEAWFTKRLVTTSEITALYNSGSSCRPTGV